MRLVALLAFSLLSIVNARVTFPSSEVLQGPDLARTNKANFHCKNICKVYADRKSDKLVITQNGGLIATFNTIVSGNPSVPTGIVLPAGDYALENKGEVNPEFVLYVVDSTAPNYGTTVYAPQQTLGVAIRNSNRYLTVLSSFEAVEFSSFVGTFQAGYPRILATGFDAAGDTQCRPVYQARSQLNAERSWPTIVSSVFTIDFGNAGSYNVSVNRANAHDPPKATGMTTVYTSPGYIGCSYAAGQNYHSTVNRISEAFTMTADNFDIDGAYTSIGDGEPIHLNINDKKVNLVGTSKYSEHYGKGTYSIALSWTRQTPESNFAFQLDFSSANDAPPTTSQTLTTSTKSGRSLSALSAVALVIASCLRV